MAEEPAALPRSTDPSDEERRSAILAWLRGQPVPGIDAQTLRQWSVEYFRAKLPPTGGRTEETVGAVQSTARIRRDSWGIAHIAANDEHDLFFALGYAMAQDRLWQLDYQRRLVRGRLAEVLGRRALASDRMMRILSIGASGDRAWQTASAEVHEVLEAFTAGINLWAERVGSHLPIEFEILGYEPTPWEPADSIAIWKHRWWTLSGRLELIVVAEAARHLLPPALLDAFSSVELADETIVPSHDGRVPPNSARYGGGALDEGSNNWVVGGSRTTTGAPVLCSDPHNPFGAPSQWFEAQLTCPTFDAAGAVYIGTPVLYLGRNRDVAWGVTNHAVSVRDLYREETSPDRPGFYRDGTDWRPFEVERQNIAVAGEPDQVVEIQRTTRGPIVDELLPPARDILGASPISLRWLGVDVPSGFDATLALLRARSASGVVDALRQWPCPPLNFVYADRFGNFGYHAAGFVPRHRPGHGVREANDPDDAWNGFVPFDDLPHFENPPRGWLATANNVPWTRDSDYITGGAWSDGYRARQIRERLTAKEKLRPEEVASVHGDVHSIRARELVPALLDAVGSGESTLAREAITALREWDHDFTTSSIGASIWTAFWTEWCLALARARFPEALVEHATARITGVARRLLLGEAIAWLPNADVPTEIRRAFADALRSLEAWGGSNVHAWRWGDLHQVVHPHPMATTPDLQALFNTGPYPTSGGNSIVRAAGHGFKVPFAVISGSTYRFMADLSRPDHLQSVQTLGQSAHLGSPHYRDQTQLWLGNDYHPIWMREEDVLAHLESEVVIRPWMASTRRS